jgi:hypothetical protein
MIAFLLQQICQSHFFFLLAARAGGAAGDCRPSPCSQLLMLAASIQPMLPSLPTVNDVQLFLAGAAEQQQRLVRHVERHHGGCDGHRLHLLRAFSDDRRCEIISDLLVMIRHAIHDGVGDFGKTIRMISGMVILQLPLVAAKSLLDTFGSGIEGQLRIHCLAGRVQYDAAVEMNLAIGGKTGVGLLYDNLTRIPSVEVFRDGHTDLVLDPLTERITNFHMFTGYTHTHGVSLLMWFASIQFTPRLTLIQALRAISSKIGRSSRLWAP